MAQYTEAPELQELAAAVMEEYEEFEYLRASDCKIGYQWSDGKKAKDGGAIIVYADTTKISQKTKLFSGCDFVITFYKDAKGLEPWRLERLMYHELLHVGYLDGETHVVPHDCEDFRRCIARWGLNWLQEESEDGRQG